MSELLDIIISAVDEASSIFQSITGSAEEMQSQLTSIDSSSMDEMANGADQAEQEILETDNAVNELSNDLSIIDSSMLLQLGEQVSQIGDKAEGMAQDMNEAAISVGQLATQAGIAEPQMVALINNISNATFPNEEAMMYVKSLDQIGVASENLGKSATDLDKINDAFGLGAEKTNSLGQELSVLGVDMNNVSSSFNALAYANANTVGGMENYYNFLRKYDAQFKELGLNVDQASVLIAAATQKFGGGRAALSGLNKILKSTNGDLSAMEQQLGLTAGSLTNASQLTGEYAGQLDQLASEEMEHKTILDQLGAAWEDISLAVGSFLAPFLSVIGLIGQVGSFGLQIKGLTELASLTRRLTEIEIIDTAVKSAKAAVMSVVTVATTAYAAIVGVLTGEIGLVTAATMVWNAVMAMNPIVWIIAAIAALIVVIYEVGKAFGWWSNVQGMLEAIWDGINRLWSAFINHPDVQAVIQALSGAWEWLSAAIGNAWNAIMNFLGISTGGDFDIVRAIIDGVGWAWNGLKEIILTVVGVVQAVFDVFQAGWDTLAPIGEFLSGVFAEAWEFVMELLEQITPYVENLTQAWADFQSGQLDLPGLIMAVLTALFDIYVTIVSSIASLVLNFAGQLWNYAVSAGTNFLNGIVQYISQLPGRVWTFLLQVTNNVSNAGTQWVNNARNKASQLLSGVVSVLSQLPGKALSLLLNVVSSIVSAGSQWVSNARSKASEIVSGVVGILSGLPGQISSALGGVVSAITSPFKSAYDSVVGIVNNIKSQVQEGLEYIGQLGGARAGEVIDVTTGQAFDINTGMYTDSAGEPIEVNVNENITLEVNAPAHIDTSTLITALENKEVLKALTANRDFQDLDAKVKERINLQIKRGRGV